MGYFASTCGFPSGKETRKNTEKSEDNGYFFNMGYLFHLYAGANQAAVVQKPGNRNEVHYFRAGCFYVSRFHSRNFSESTGIFISLYRGVYNLSLAR